MAARVIWKGSISFGLVYVPVALYSGEKRNELSLTQLDSRDLSPVGYRRVNKNTGDEVPWDTIVKGYEYQKGEYVLLNEEDFRQANVEKTQTVDIVDFVDAAQIPLRYYDKPYVLEPIQRGEKGYALLRETLRRTGKAGIAKVVLHTRQHLAALVPQGDLLVLNLLRYAYELRDAGEYSVPGNDLAAFGITDRELDMAQRLVESMVVEWQPEKYRDDYRDDLLARIDEKVQRGETRYLEEPHAATPPSAEVIDLMSLLKQSVEKTSRERKAPERKSPAGKGGRSRKKQA